MLTLLRFHRLVILLLPAICSFAAEPEGADYFERHVRPVLVEQCYACHSSESTQPQAALRVDSRDALLTGGLSGPAVLPGDPEGSRLIQVLRHSGNVRMPPGGKLTDEQVDRIAAWIHMGAPFPTSGKSRHAAEPEGRKNHWAFDLPTESTPARSASGWAQTAIDRFVESRLVQAGLEPSPEAPPRKLLRRLYYDLTGLPPKPRETEAFVRSHTADAYESIVDSLLASKQFGERWARHWLDIVRYSDEGFQARPFAIAWTYRDWVVDALNDDLPYGDFISLQLAADLVGGDKRNLAALGMLTLGINLPRPTDVPENLDDRIDVVTRGFLGLSVTCAKCHDHKFDRITQEDYYALYGVFLNSPNVLEPVPIEEAGSGQDPEFFREKLATRRSWIDRFRAERLEDHVREFREPGELARYLESAWEARQYSNRQAEALSKEKNLNLYLLNRWRKYLNRLVGPSIQAFAELDSPGGALRVAQRIADADSLYRWPDPEREALRLALRGNGSPTDIPLEDFWWIQNEGDSNVMKALKWQYDAVVHDWSYRGGPEHAMVVEDAKRLQPAYIFNRGNQHDKGAQVERRFLSALAGPTVFRSGSGRLELARAIASPDNPLTARVLVNRVWGHLFGEGIVRTPSDFGIRGDRPSHPRLLDYLASEFSLDGGSIKRLVKRIVLSRTYRQDSADSGSGRAIDPVNRLLWRQNRTRLDFEAIRDSMLAVSGRLDTGLGGPPFDLAARPSSARRTLYAYVSREEPSALMRTFDFSNPEEHTPRRQLTTVPQQALFLMNGSFVAEQARALVARCEDFAQCVDSVHLNVLGRPLDSRERNEAMEFLALAGETASEELGAAPNRTWLHGTARLDPGEGEVKDFRSMDYRVDDRLQPSPMLASRIGGRAGLTALGGFPGDGLDSAVVRRWTALRSMRVAVQGTLNHPLSSQARRFDYSNGIRGWLISSKRGLLGNWTVRGFEAETTIRNLEVDKGEYLDFVVDSLGDYESDSFQWSPRIEEQLTADQRQSGMEPQSWSAEEDFPGFREEPLGPLEQYAQVLLMTNEFAIRD